MRRGNDSLPIDSAALKHAIHGKGLTCAIVSSGIGMSQSALYQIMQKQRCTKPVRNLLRERFGITEAQYVKLDFLPKPEPKREPAAATAGQLDEAALRTAIKQAIREVLSEMLMGGAA